MSAAGRTLPPSLMADARLLKCRRAPEESSDPVLFGLGRSGLGAAAGAAASKGERHQRMRAIAGGAERNRFRPGAGAQAAAVQPGFRNRSRTIYAFGKPRVFTSWRERADVLAKLNRHLRAHSPRVFCPGLVQHGAVLV